MQTIDIQIPAKWVEGLSLSQDDLREALKIGLKQLQTDRQSAELHRHHVQNIFISGGLSISSTQLPAPSKIDPARREELAQLFSVGQPLSETIIEERASGA